MTKPVALLAFALVATLYIVSTIVWPILSHARAYLDVLR